MMTKLYAWMLGCLAVLGWLGLAAQTPTQVIVANGGVFGVTNAVTVGAWNLSTGGYTVFDTFPGSSVQHVLIDGDDAYVCADSTVMKYSLTSYQRLAEARVGGARQSAIYGDKLIITKGYGTVPGSGAVEVRYTSNLSLAYAVTGITGDCEGVVVVGDTAYVANPGLFGSPTGNLAVIDLTAQALDRIVALDSMGKVIQDVYAANGHVYAVSTHGFGSPLGYFSDYAIPSASLTHHLVSYNLSTTGGIYGGMLYADLGGMIGTIDLSNGAATQISGFPGGFAAMALDSVNGQLLGTRSDFATYGLLYRYSLTGVVLDSVTIGISPEAVAVDYNMPVGAASPQLSPSLVKAYPQPFGDHLTVDLHELGNASRQVLRILDLQGRTLMESTAFGNAVVELETTHLPAGAYILQVQGRQGVATQKLIKTTR